MNRTVNHCRKCGQAMKRERTGVDHVHWICACGLRDRTPLTRVSSGGSPYQKGDVFAQIRFRAGGDVMLEVARNNDERFELISLDEITRLVSEEIPQAKALDEIAGKIASRMRVEVCSVYLNRGGQLVLSATHGLAKEAVGKVRLAIGEGITGAAAKTGKPIAVPDAAADPRYRHFAVAREERYKAMLSHPILEEGGRVVGVVNIQTVRVRSFTPAEQSYISVVAGLIRACLRLRDRVRDVPVEAPPDGR
ncbi:MAG TPA: GAF domain-containing protein [Candidatus Deferrimicrobiaceae bacterium]